jgi:hypothetical protein
VNEGGESEWGSRGVQVAGGGRVEALTRDVGMGSSACAGGHLEGTGWRVGLGCQRAGAGTWATGVDMVGPTT